MPVANPPQRHYSFAQSKGKLLIPAKNPRLNRYSTVLANEWGDGTGVPSGEGGGHVQIKFKIYADGRVEETVKGVKGMACNQITDELNEKLGQVITSKPTEEAFQQEVTVKNEQKVENKWG